jgi:hypothetical protein
VRGWFGEKTLPESVVDYLCDPSKVSIEQATTDLCNTALLPRALADSRQAFAPCFRKILEQHKIRVWRERIPTIGEFIEEISSEVTKGTMGNSGAVVFDLISEITRNYDQTPFTEQTIQQISQRVDKTISDSSNSKETKLSATTRQNLERLKKLIREKREEIASRPSFPPQASITIPQLISLLNDSGQAALYVIQSHDPDMLRHFASMLGDFTFDSRRKTGQITPLVSFIFDEADEFIPQQARDTYAESADVAMTLARRGRKFGLGIGIATQRVRYLNTSIMAQPHTYFVSKMPRKTDREAVSDAFGVSEEMFRQTFKFKKGDWLLVSYDATGLEAIPVPIHCEDANERVRAFLERGGEVAASGTRSR